MRYQIGMDLFWFRAEARDTQWPHRNQSLVPALWHLSEDEEAILRTSVSHLTVRLRLAASR